MFIWEVNLVIYVIFVCYAKLIVHGDAHFPLQEVAYAFVFVFKQLA